RRVNVAKSAMEILSDPRYNVCVLAITEELNLPPGLDLTGKLIVDDSQPPALIIEQVERAGGKLVWPISRDRTKSGLITRTSFDYNFTGPAKPNENWGCELEAAVVGMPGGEPDLALRKPLTPE